MSECKCGEYRSNIGKVFKQEVSGRGWKTHTEEYCGHCTIEEITTLQARVADLEGDNERLREQCNVNDVEYQKLRRDNHVLRMKTVKQAKEAE